MAQSYDSIIEQFENGTVVERAAALALQYGQIDGAHHKTWTIDQMLRILVGDRYNELVTAYTEDGAYEWDTGICP